MSIYKWVSILPAFTVHLLFLDSFNRIPISLLTTHTSFSRQRSHYRPYGSNVTLSVPMYFSVTGDKFYAPVLLRFYSHVMSRRVSACSAVWIISVIDVQRSRGKIGGNLGHMGRDRVRWHYHGNEFCPILVRKEPLV